MRTKDDPTTAAAKAAEKPKPEAADNGGQPLEGSGFEQDEPNPEFQEEQDEQ